MVLTPDTPMYSAFLHFINNYGLHQYVDKSTRGDNILDIVLSSSVSLINDMQVTAPFSTNDHNSVIFNVNVSGDDGNTSSCNLDPFYDYACANIDGLSFYRATANAYARSCCLSVRPSNACTVTKQNNLLTKFLYHIIDPFI